MFMWFNQVDLKWKKLKEKGSGFPKDSSSYICLTKQVHNDHIINSDA